MTISIAAAGRNAGRAVIEALRKAEAVCEGAIGGFVVAGSINNNSVIRAQTQTGGVSSLRFKGDEAHFNAGTIAGLISSGPNRPEPIAGFLVAAADSGLVTGHRLPNSIGIDSKPMNQSVLDALSSGQPVDDAVSLILNLNPQADCGLIAIDRHGNGHSGNTTGMTRPDAGIGSGRRNNSSVWVLHNAVEPIAPLASLLVSIALDCMEPDYVAAGSITLSTGCDIRPGDSTRIIVDDAKQAIAIEVGEHYVSTIQPCPVNIGYRPAVFRNDKLIGCLLYEPFVCACEGKLVSADGLCELTVPIGIPSSVVSQQRRLPTPQ